MGDLDVPSVVFSNVRHPFWAVRRSSAEVRRSFPDVRGRSAEVRRPFPKVRGRFPSLRGWLPKVRGRSPELREWPPEGGFWPKKAFFCLNWPFSTKREAWFAPVNPWRISRKPQITNKLLWPETSFLIQTSDLTPLPRLSCRSRGRMGRRWAFGRRPANRW